MIDPESGTLVFEEVRIARGLTRAELAAAPWAHGAIDAVVNEPWHSWTLPGEYRSAGQRFAVVLYFHGDRLVSVSLSAIDPESSWEDWSEGEELARKRAHDEWLSSALGAERSFPWGSVSSAFDRKSGFSSITIRYSSSAPRESP